MGTRRFALILGVVYVLVGIAGFIPGLVSPPPSDAPNLVVQTRYGMLFGIAPVNIIHNLIHLLIGAWGLLASRDFDAAKVFAKATAIIFGVLFIMGLIPILNTTFGVAPIFGGDIVLHLVTSLVATYFGYMAEQRYTTPAI
jgi:hypothetical protein